MILRCFIPAKLSRHCLLLLPTAALLSVSCVHTKSAYEQSQADAIYNVLAANLALHEGNRQQAIEHYVQALEETSDAELIRQMVRLAFEEQDYELAQRAVERWARKEPENFPVKQLLAVIYLSTNQADKAVAVAEDLKAQQQAEPVFMEIAAYGLPVMDETVLDNLSVLVRHFPDDAMAHYAYAMTAVRIGRYDVAISIADRILEIAPDLAAGYEVKAYALERNGQIKESADVAADALNRFPNKFNIRKLYARLLYQLRRYQAAYPQLRIVYMAEPDSPDILQMLGEASVETGRITEALNYFQQLEDFPGFNLRAAYLQAYAYFEHKNFDRAHSLLQGIPPASGALFEKAQLLTARIYLELSMEDTAVEQFINARKVTQDRELRIVFYLAQGEVLNGAQRYTEAYELYTQALEEYADHHAFRRLRAYVAGKSGHLELMEKDVLYLLRQDASDVDALNMIGYFFADLNVRLEEANDYIQRAYDLSPEDPRIIDSLGWVKFRLNDLPGAEALIRKAAEMYPDPEIFGHLVEILRAQNRHVEAQRQLDSARKTFPDDEYLRTLDNL